MEGGGVVVITSIHIATGSVVCVFFFSQRLEPEPIDRGPSIVGSIHAERKIVAKH